MDVSDKMNPYHLTVIIPVYNCEKYIEAAVQSVLNQPERSIGIVLVNDGSTDGSAQLCDALSEKSTKIHVIHKQNGGVSSARNCGIDYVLDRELSPYIAFLDADDAWTDGFMNENTVSLLQQGYDAVGFRSCVCNSQLTPVGQPLPLTTGTYDGGAQTVWKHSSQSFAAMIYSAALLQEYGVRFPETVAYSEDKMFSMQVLYLADNVHLSDAVFYRYRQNEWSAMHCRKYGIEYYVPVISAYLDMDKKMERWANDRRGEFWVGRMCAQQYIMDMIDEHFQHFRPRKELDNVLGAEYIDLMQTATGNQNAAKRYRFYCRHRYVYIFKNYLKGVFVAAKQQIKTVVVNVKRK